MNINRIILVIGISIIIGITAGLLTSSSKYYHLTSGSPKREISKAEFNKTSNYKKVQEKSFNSQNALVIGIGSLGLLLITLSISTTLQHRSGKQINSVIETKKLKKKIIAREILILTGTISLTLIVLLGILLYNGIKHAQIKHQSKEISALEVEIELLMEPINGKLERQMWFYNEIPNNQYKTYTDLWSRFEYLHLTDSIHYKIIHIWNEYAKQRLRELDYINCFNIKSVLQEYVATANNPKYKSWNAINSKFPELSDYDKDLLKDYVATANNPKYNSWDVINSKFPEFFYSDSILADILDNFIKTNSVSISNPQLIAKIDTLNQKIDLITNKKKKNKLKIIDYSKLGQIALISFLIIFIVSFIIRYLWYGIRWSIKNYHK